MFFSLTKRQRFGATARGPFFTYRHFCCCWFRIELNIFEKLICPRFVNIFHCDCRILSKMTTETEAIKIIKSILNLRCRDGATLADIERK